MQKESLPDYFLKYSHTAERESISAPFDLQKICRLCLQELQDGSCVDLFAINHFPVSPLAMITRCASIQIYEKDGFPTTICNVCYCKLEMAYEFRNRCEASDQKLRAMLNNPNDGSKTSEQLLSMNETPESNKDDAIYHAMKEIFGPDVDPDSIIIPPPTANLLDGTIEQELASSPVAPLKVKMKRQIKRKSQLDELLVKHKEKLWLESKKVKIIRQKRSVRKQPATDKKRVKEAEQQELKSGDPENPFECTVCQRRFHRASNLRLHMRIHSNERHFQCEICSKLFRTSSNLHAHRKTHSDERNFACTVCERAFRTSRDRESEEPEELSIEVDENRSLESAASSELSVATSLMDSQSYSYGGMPYAQTFVPQPPPPPPPPHTQPTAQHFSHVSHQHHHLHPSHAYGHPHHRHNHHQQQPIIHQSMGVGSQPAANLYPTEYLPTYHHSTGLSGTHQPHYELGGYDMCYSMPASTVLNPSVMNPQPTYIFDQ
uniref:Protein krueppel n=1 Tax=Anopheles epiroticus TaxID=199890 RepID=A0A182PPS2_9DIPT